MAKRVDITEKLAFDDNPCLVIRGAEVEVNADAPTMLKVMGLMTTEGDAVELKSITEAYALIFPEESRAKIDAMKLSVNDWIKVVEAAIDLVVDGGEGSQGE